MKENKIYPASVIQQQLWFINQMHPRNSAYNIPSVFRVKGKLNIKMLEMSIRRIVNKHEILRTIFTHSRGKLTQVIREEMDIGIVSADLLSNSVDERKTKIQSVIDSEVLKPFDLNNGPLLRVKILNTAADECILLITMHHIITDLRSKELFSEELSNHYNAYVRDEEMSSSLPSFQYSDFTAGEKKFLKSGKFSSMLSFLKKQLYAKNGTIDLPTDHQRPAVQSLRGSAQILELDKEFTQELKQFSRLNNVNIFLTMLAAYIALLHRYTGNKELTVGVPLTNRRREDHKAIMGCFVNILPLPFDLSGDPTFKEFLGNVRKIMLDAHRNQEVPFKSIVDTLQPVRDPSYNPLFQTGFTFEPPMELNLEGLAIEPVKTHNRGSQLDLFAILWESSIGINGFFEYSTDLFKKETIQRFIENYKTLLKEIITNADRPVSIIPVLSDLEKNKILVDWNATDISFPYVTSVQQMLEKQVTKTPSEVAAVFEEKQLTYDELNRKANQLAHFLRTKGFGQGNLVGVFMERSLKMIVSLLGILKAGAAFVPLDPDFPRARILYMIEHAEIRVLLTNEHLKVKLPKSQALVISFEKDWEDIGKELNENPINDTVQNDLAYVIYTSGSTGKPKGVKVHQGALTNFLYSMATKPGLDKSNILLAVTTLSFDIAMLEIFLPLVVGARLVIASRDDASDGSRLLQALSKYKITTLQATPTTWRLLIAAGWTGKEKLKVLCGGEPLPLDLAKELITRSTDVWNMYGPTETTIWSTCCRITDTKGPILVGRPIANTKIYILDLNMQPAPIGVSGEMYIGGVGVTKGYFKQPDKTAEVFVKNPFSDAADEIIYNTGDIARYLPGGNIEVLGRIDHQVKIRGYRIELGEIESILQTHPTVKQCVVVALEKEPGNKHLTAYYVQEEGDRPKVSDFREHLSQSLPDYMIPSIYMGLDIMPLTPNGKINRLALPKPDYKRPDLKEAYAAPKNETEIKLSDIWQDVLGIDQIGIHDKFFEIGGNSLLAVQIISRLKEELGIVVPVVSIFSYPTIASLANYVDNKTTVSMEKVQVQSGKQIAALKKQQQRALLARRRQRPQI